MTHASRDNILNALQHGFRDKRSCETQLMEFIQDVSYKMQQCHKTNACVLDFSKAFDKVEQNRLIDKLK